MYFRPGAGFSTGMQDSLIIAGNVFYYLRTSASIPMTISPMPTNHLIKSGNTSTRTPRIMAITPIPTPDIFIIVSPRLSND
jgi:hypothetical protein